MTARPIRRLIAALGLVMMPLMAGAQPAKLYLDPVSGNCSDLNFKWVTTGVNDLAGSHPGLWARTHYELVINEVSVKEHEARNWVDLNQGFSIQTISSGGRTCLQASAFDIRFGSRTQITRIHWDPLFPPCQPCATEWANHMTFIDSHERKHLSGIMAAVETANSEWPRGFLSARVIEVCGPAGAMIIRNLLPKLREEIGAQLRATGTRLHSQIKEHATALDRRESLGFMNCSVCRCQVPAECKDVTVSPHVIRGGAPASGDVTFLSAAPPGGADVLLKSDNPAASIPSQINVPEGATNQTFGMTLTPVQQIKQGFIYATRPGAGRICRAELWVYPPELVKLELRPG